MRFGYFDDEKREYVIDRPDTPAPWANYLGSPEYGALISNQAGGYSFAKSGANGRILRYIFNQSDQPGRYIYIRDHDTKDYWSASWQPVGKDLGEYQSECRHGTGYTKMTADYSGDRRLRIMFHTGSRMRSGRCVLQTVPKYREICVLPDMRNLPITAIMNRIR